MARTVFVIAHRLSTVCNSDAIMVLEHGRIIERSTHDELIAAVGEYYQLCHRLTRAGVGAFIVIEALAVALVGHLVA